jgi:hypothetical protein
VFTFSNNHKMYNNMDLRRSPGHRSAAPGWGNTAGPRRLYIGCSGVMDAAHLFFEKIIPNPGALPYILARSGRPHGLFR